MALVKSLEKVKCHKICSSKNSLQLHFKGYSRKQNVETNLYKYTAVLRGKFKEAIPKRKRGTQHSEQFYQLVMCV